METLPPDGIPAYSWRLIVMLVIDEMYEFEDVILIAITSPGFLLWMANPFESYAILQVVHPLTVVVSTKVILKLVELPKYLGLPSPDKVRSMNPDGFEMASTCK